MVDINFKVISMLRFVSEKSISETSVGLNNFVFQSNNIAILFLFIISFKKFPESFVRR